MRCEQFFLGPFQKLSLPDHLHRTCLPMNRISRPNPFEQWSYTLNIELRLFKILWESSSNPNDLLPLFTIKIIFTVLRSVLRNNQQLDLTEIRWTRSRVNNVFNSSIFPLYLHFLTSSFLSCHHTLCSQLVWIPRRATSTALSYLWLET